MMVTWRRRPKMNSLPRPSYLPFFRTALTSLMTAGMEEGTLALGERRTAIVLAQMPLTRHAGFFRGCGDSGRGAGAVFKLELETTLSILSLGAPGSSLETRSKRVIACWMCLVVGADFPFLGGLGFGDDVAVTEAYVAGTAGFSGAPEPGRSRRLAMATVKRSRRRPRCSLCCAR